jgi:4-carboxymuconolactone decarboxylase
MDNPSSSKAKIQSVLLKRSELIEGTVYGDLWQTDQMRSHFEKALANGVTAEEITEMITHLSVYAGFPAPISAAIVAKPPLADLGLIDEGQAG